MNIDTTRRALIGAITAAVPVAALARIDTIGTNALEWNRALVIFERARAASKAHDEHYLPAFERYYAEREAVPHRTTTSTYASMAGERISMCTERKDHLSTARRMLSRLSEWGSDLDDYIATCREVLDLEAQRKAEIDAIGDRYGITNLNNRSDQLADAEADAEATLIRMPAPNTQALLWKLERLFGPDARGAEDSSPCYAADWIDPVLADAHRLLATGRA